MHASCPPSPVTLCERPVRRAVVIGSGSMGSGIAALLACTGAEVTLLDMAGDAEDRNARAAAGKALQVKRKGFTHPSFADNITVGNTEDDLEKVRDTDWGVEAIFENAEAKLDLYASLEEYLGETTVVSSNTSTIPLEVLTSRMGQAMKRRFFITHFFNPPRIMKLVELVLGPESDHEAGRWLKTILDVQLGKHTLVCRDTPGFIANRVGNLWMAAAAAIALEENIPIELADAVASRPFGVPRTGIFGLFDYVGLQLVPDVWGSTTRAVGDDDAYRRFDIAGNPVFASLIERGLTGRTGASGFYRGENEVFDPATLSYRPINGDYAQVSKIPLEVVLDEDSQAGRYARDVFLQTLVYCCEIASEIADTVEDIDIALQLGYGWKKGPFALADQIGLEKVARLITDFHETRPGGRDLVMPALLERAVEAGGFYPAPGTVCSTSGTVISRPAELGARSAAKVCADDAASFLFNNDDASIVSVGQVGVVALKTKLGTISPGVLEAFEAARRLADEGRYQALVIANVRPGVFSAGADLTVLSSIASGQDREVSHDRQPGFIDRGIAALLGLKYAPVPVVAAVEGLALGGGAELMLHCDAAVIQWDTRIGFPEREVGLFAGWGGPIQQVIRLQQRHHADAIGLALSFSAQAAPARGAYPAWEVGLVSDTDQIVARQELVFEEACRLAEKLSVNYQPPQEPTVSLSPESAEDLAHHVSKDCLQDAGDEADRASILALARLFTGSVTATESEPYRTSVNLAHGLIARPHNAAKIRSALARLSGSS